MNTNDKSTTGHSVDSNTLLELIRGGYKSGLGKRGDDHTVTIFFAEDDYMAAEALHNAITGNSNDLNEPRGK